MGEISKNIQKGALMRKRIGVILSSILAIGMLAACKNAPVTDQSAVTVTPTPGFVVTLTPRTEDEYITVAPSETTELPIYTINGDFTELTAVSVLVVAEKVITEDVVTEAVLDALADNAIYVKVNKISRDNDRIIVDFSADAPPVSQVGAGIEGLILDAFGQSLLDNVFGCNSVSFSVDGMDYASGHLEFSKDEIYMRR